MQSNMLHLTATAWRSLGRQQPPGLWQEAPLRQLTRPQRAAQRAASELPQAGPPAVVAPLAVVAARPLPEELAPDSQQSRRLARREQKSLDLVSAGTRAAEASRTASTPLVAENQVHLEIVPQPDRVRPGQIPR